MPAALETDLFAEFVLARSAAELSDDTIRSDAINLEQVRDWFARPLWETEPQDADMYFGRVLRNVAQGLGWLRGSGVSLERLRVNRTLEETLAHGGDPLHLMAVFGMSDTAAIQYATNVRALLHEPTADMNHDDAHGIHS
ncbi:hypothetical protein AB4Z54_37380 [Streptomyces sp. MCAF7]